MTTTPSKGRSSGGDLLGGQDTKRSPLARLQHLLHAQATVGPAAVLLVAIVVFAVLSPRFLTPGNISLILQQVAVIGTLAVGQTVVILTAGIDLSCGAIMVFSSMVMAKTAFENGVPGWAALLLGLAVGAGAGAVMVGVGVRLAVSGRSD